MAAPTVVGAVAQPGVSGSSTISCPLPAGVQAGDRVYAWIAARAGGVSSAGYSFAPPAGYGPVGTGTAHDTSFITAGCYVKLLTGADASTGNFTLSGQTASPTNPISVEMLVIAVRGDGTDQVVFSTSNGSANTAVACSSATTSVDSELVITFAAQAQSSTFTVNNSAAIQVQSKQAQSGGNLAVAVATGSQANAGATGATTFTASGSGHWVGLTLTVSPQAAGGGGSAPSGGIQFGWGEGHMDGFAGGELDDCMSVQNYVFGAGSFVRSNMTKTKSSLNGNLTNGSWAYLDTLITKISGKGCIFYPTFSLTNSDPVAATASELANWNQMIQSGLTYLKSKTAGGSSPIAGFTMPPAVEITNEPGNQSSGGGGPISPTQLYVMIKEAKKAITAWNTANGGSVKVHGPGIAGAGNYSSPNNYAADARSYVKKVYDAAKADSSGTGFLSDYCMSINWHTYHPPGDPLTDPGSGNGHTQWAKSLIYTRADMDLATYGMSLSGAHPMYQGVSEGNYKDNDHQNKWTGPGGVKAPNGVYCTEAQRKSDGPIAGSMSAETGLPAVWNYWIQNAATLGIIHINQYKYVDHHTATSNWDTYEDLGLGRRSSDSPNLQYKAKATALKNLLGNLSPAPTVTLNSPTQGTTITGNQCTVNVTASGPSGISEVDVKVNGGSYTAITHGSGSTYQGTVTLTLGAVGTTHSNTIQVRAIGADSANTITELPAITVFALNADNTAPTLTVTNPASLNTSVANGVTTQNFAGTATDNVGVTSLKVNGVEQVPLGSGGSFSTSVNLSVGSNAIPVVATDAAGNTNTQTFNVQRAQASGDTTPPTLTITTPASATTTVTNATTTQVVQGSASDTSGIASVTVNGVSQSLSGGNFTSAGVALSVGANTITVVATDSSANANVTTVTLTVNRSASADVTGPTVTMTSPTDGQLVIGEPGDAVSVIGNATDTSGVASLTINGVATPLDNSGNYNATVTLSLGANAVTAVAVDSVGNVTTLTHNVTLATSGSGTPGDTLIISDDLSELQLRFKQRGVT